MHSPAARSTRLLPARSEAVSPSTILSLRIPLARECANDAASPSTLRKISCTACCQGRGQVRKSSVTRSGRDASCSISTAGSCYDRSRRCGGHLLSGTWSLRFSLVWLTRTIIPQRCLVRPTSRASEHPREYQYNTYTYLKRCVCRVLLIR